MKILKEITEWDVEHRQPNHTYLLNAKNQIVAYAKWNGDEIDELKSRIVLNKRYRKFIESNHTGLSKLIPKYNNEIQPEEKREEFKPVYERTFKVKSGEKVYGIVEINGKDLDIFEYYLGNKKCYFLIFKFIINFI
jgi:hypothetical protein